MSSATVTIERSDLGARLDFKGDVLIGAIEGLRQNLASMPGAGEVVVDLTGVDRLDTAGAWLLVDLMKRLKDEGVTARLEGANEAQTDLIDTVTQSLPVEHPQKPRDRGFVPWLATLGKSSARSFNSLIEIIGFFGLVLVRTFGVLVRPWRLRWTSMVHHMQEAGYNAVPIVSLMAFLIGVVLAFQGAAQLRQFGAEVFVVDLIAISLLRELGILLTAIIIAGRSGSAFTAAIGSMKMRQEIDAMRTLGLDPVEVLVVPRVLALLVMLPVLGFIANFMGLVGGAMMSWLELGVSPGMFRARMLDSVHVSNLIVGMVKAPFFAIIIALIGCYEGLKVEGDSESLGQRTSKSVVLAIFFVIVTDAVFSIFFALMNL